MESGHLVGDALPAGDDGFARAVPNEHQVGFLPPHLQDVFFVPDRKYLINSPKVFN